VVAYLTCAVSLWQADSSAVASLPRGVGYPFATLGEGQSELERARALLSLAAAYMKDQVGDHCRPIEPAALVLPPWLP